MMRPGAAAAPRPTAFSRLDFRAKLAAVLAASLAAVLWDDPGMGALLALATIGACLAAGIGARYLALVGRVMAPFLLLLVLTHGFFNVQLVLRLTGRAALTPLFTVPPSWPLAGSMVFSREGFLYGISVVCKSVTLLLLVPLCVLTTDPNNIVVGLVRMKVPYKFAFAFSSTLRFFPLLLEEIGLVIEAQRLRGFAVEEMGVAERVRTYAKVAIPVTLGAMFKAQQIEIVLQARGFSGSARRTYLHDSELGLSGRLVVAASVAAAALVVILRLEAHIGAFRAGLLP